LQTLLHCNKMPLALEQEKTPFSGFLASSKRVGNSLTLKEEWGFKAAAASNKARFGLATADNFQPSALRTAQCDALALSLMLPYKDNLNGLLGRLQGMGVQVLNGSELPWVDQYLAKNGADAAFRLPNTNKAVGASGSLSTASLLGFPSTTPANADALFNASHQPANLSATDRVSLLIRSGPVKGATVLHEAFHVIQALAGTPVTKVDAESHAEAYQAWQRFSEKMNNPFFQLKLFFFTLPTLQHKLNQNNGASPWPASPTGIAIRDWMKQELEACNFIVKEGSNLGLTQTDIVENQGRFKLYDAFRMLSYQFDRKAFEEKKAEALTHFANLPQYAGATHVSAFAPVVLDSPIKVAKPANQALIPALR
jgi:hypothetical protein